MRSAIMSSIAMAADSTQADVIHHRVKTSVPRRTGTRGAHLLQEDCGRSRHHGLSQSFKQSQSYKHFQNRSKIAARRNQSRIHDDCSDHDSDLDLSKDLLPISGYVRIKDEMVDHMFHSISNRKLRAMLPEILKPLGTEDLKKLCVEQLEVMSKKRICCILDGADPDTISSSGTEEDDSYEEENSIHSTDIDNEDRDIVSASVESEAVGSTSLCKADEVKVRNNQERYLTVDKDFCDDVSSEKKESIIEGTEKIRDSDQEQSKMEKDVDTYRTTDETTAFQQISRENEEDNDHQVLLCKDKNIGDYVYDEIARDETIKQGRRNAERSYRTKQLDDDDHENNGDGRRPSQNSSRQNNKDNEVMIQEQLDACLPKDHQMVDSDCISDIRSIPGSLPSLDSEPEETCFPLIILNSDFINATDASGNMTTLESSKLTFQLISENAEDLGSGLRAGSSQKKLTDTTMDAAELAETPKVCKDVSTKSQMNNDDCCNAKIPKKTPQESSGSKTAELVTEGEEMIIEVQDHEFSDDVGDEEINNEFGCDGKTIKCRDLPQRMFKQNFGIEIETSFHKEDEQEKSFEKRLPDISKTHSMQKQRLFEEEIIKPGNTAIQEVESVENDKTIDSRGLKRKVIEKSETSEISPKCSKVLCHNIFAGKGQTHVILEQRLKCAVNNINESSENILSSNRDTALDRSCQSDLAVAEEICIEKRGSLQEAQKLQTDSTESDSVASFEYSDPAEQSKTEQLLTTKIVTHDIAAVEAHLSVEAENERSVLQKSNIENYRIEASHKKEAVNHSHSKAVHSYQCSKAATEDNGAAKESVQVLSKTQLELLELEMRARAIKAMLKAQEELERREEKLKFEEKHYPISQMTSQTSRFSQSSECHRVITEERKEPRFGPYRDFTLAVESRSTQGGEGINERFNQKSVRQTQQHKDFQLVKKQPQLPIRVPNRLSQTKLDKQSLDRLPIKSHREVMASNKFSNFVKKPVMVTARGRGAIGSSLTSSGGITRRIIRLSSGQRTADTRTVVHGPSTLTSRTVTSTSDRISKPVACNRNDVRRVIATSCSNQVARLADNTFHNVNRSREHRSATRDQRRSVTWQRHPVTKQGSRGKRF